MWSSQIIILQNNGVKVVVKEGGRIGEKELMKLPGANLQLGAFTERDDTDLTEFGIKFGVDIISVSFTRKREEIDYVKDLLERTETLVDKKSMQVFAKIENLEGLNNYDEILSVADGIIISRSDIEQEVPPNKMFLAQKWMIEKSNLAAKPVICSGSMLESMVELDRPDRREAEDVAIVVTDGADAVLLSDAAANGKHSMEALNTIGRCCAEAERTIDFKGVLSDLKDGTPKMLTNDDGLAASAISAVLNMDLELVIVVTQRGDLPRLLSKYRPSVPLLTFCSDELVIRQLAITRGVITQKLD